jgi:hypothetical protein
VPFGVPVVRGENLGNNRFIGGEFVFVSREKAERLSANKARPGDIVFTQRGNAVLTGGQVAIVPAQPFDEYIVSQSQMKLTVNTVIASISYLYYVFRSRDHREYLRNHAVTTGVPHTNLKTLRDFQFLLPPLPEQCAVADVLGTLDDKIEQNRRTSQVLERLARAIVRAWFVLAIRCGHACDQIAVPISSFTRSGVNLAIFAERPNRPPPHRRIFGGSTQPVDAVLRQIDTRLFPTVRLDAFGSRFFEGCSHGQR